MTRNNKCLQSYFRHWRPLQNNEQNFISVEGTNSYLTKLSIIPKWLQHDRNYTKTLIGISASISPLLYLYYMVSKWNGWLSCSFSNLSIWRSLTWSIKMMIVITTHVALSDITLIQINLLGVTNNWAFHWDGSSGGHGTTTICEFGITWVHVRCRPDSPTAKESRKLAVRPKKLYTYI